MQTSPSQSEQYLVNIVKKCEGSNIVVPWSKHDVNLEGLQTSQACEDTSHFAIRTVDHRTDSDSTLGLQINYLNTKYSECVLRPSAASSARIERTDQSMRIFILIAQFSMRSGDVLGRQSHIVPVCYVCSGGRVIVDKVDQVTSRSRELGHCTDSNNGFQG